MRSFPLLSLLLVFILPICVGGCGYGKVSPKAYEYAKGLYGVCSRRDENRLKKISSMIDQAQKRGEITEEEEGWLNEIVKQGKAGNWDSAIHMARRMMEDQAEGR